MVNGNDGIIDSQGLLFSRIFHKYKEEHWFHQESGPLSGLAGNARTNGPGTGKGCVITIFGTGTNGGFQSPENDNREGFHKNSPCFVCKKTCENDVQRPWLMKINGIFEINEINV